MKIFTEYFGEIEYTEEDIIEFEKGPLGFEEYKKYILIREEDLFVEWLQSIEEDFSLTVMNPFHAIDSYEFEIPEIVIEKLSLESSEDVIIKTVVIISEKMEDIRTNLQSPIIINAKTKKAKQIILDDNYPMKHYFYKGDE
ncbi:flagellar assembly factor FliW [Acetoanaerobium pronyense]|uniref:Flagellar assembly factor FliW n=1 Tax=Acetoanaerobium pronyense TaxID=1482736 RepID=A0ABS4KJ35_9FIRM|nr:flagellar assembly protein FliW [Acetoanaerobium pronyense]MBP2027787.1 flagellar assembly factor FliW [Acetoanaerobium pronyense]